MVEKKKLIHEPYNKLKGFMRENGIIYSHIAELLGVTPTTVSQKVNGQSDFTVSEAEPEQEAETGPSVEAEPEPAKEPVDVDRMIFTAFDAVVGRVDDFNKMAVCWRKALSVIEQEIRKLSYIIEQHPDADVSVCEIAAVIAYDEVCA